jgi:hypothetical protein
VLGKGLQIVEIRREDGPSGFRDCNNEGVDCGASTGASPQQRGATRQWFSDFFEDIASLEEPIGESITPKVAFQTLYKDRGWYEWRPQPLVAQGLNQCNCLSRLLGKAAYATRI